MRLFIGAVAFVALAGCSTSGSIETETGYKIFASTAFSGVALAVVEQSSSGFLVKVFLSMDWAGTSGWKDSARACL